MNQITRIMSSFILLNIIKMFAKLTQIKVNKWIIILLKPLKFSNVSKIIYKAYTIKYKTYH